MSSITQILFDPRARGIRAFLSSLNAKVRIYFQDCPSRIQRPIKNPVTLTTTFILPMSRIPAPQAYRLDSYRSLPSQEVFYPPPYNPQPKYPQPQPAAEHERWPSTSSNASLADRTTRTPSPTPSEFKALNPDAKLPNEKKPGVLYYVVIALIIALAVLFIVFHDKIIKALTPATNWAHDHKFGWLIPVGILFVLSFPPELIKLKLFGHEIIGLLCGVGWGLGVGFCIVALGTLLGEIANFFVFKYWCSARAQKYEKKQIQYACLSKILREGGFKIAVAARYSIIPPHITTAVFASSGIGFFTFLAAAVCSLPRQLVIVYTGVLFEDEANGTATKKEKIASTLVTVIFTIITVITYRYLKKEMQKVTPEVVYQRRKARQAENLKKLSSEESLAAAA
ncbi:hypothetical protein GYMLUDRAFT_241440 [Collybiopsis luxurians FD-317 M1]|uniref:Golgi apparatus membrane protein TVP38 n=1 Tax=Collybiopsis luxurians FD-317 M1 TaxID=944289 RepID=A0A0D0D4F1_9AGAR|nr:hypothetical protein GYMLUDRAFT_241440 [Collybiopsis luxurians FD-317 M1]